MRILWCSVAPWIPSGYGTQTGIWTRALKQLGHDVMCYSYVGLNGQSVIWQDGIQVQPRGRNSQFGWEILPYYYELHEADVCITLTDLFAMAQVTNVMATTTVPRHNPAGPPRDKMKFAHWMPIDASPLSAPDFTHLERLRSAVPIAMSRFGEAQLATARQWEHDRTGHYPWPESVYWPHAIDTDVFAPLDYGTRATFRQELGLGEETFVIGINAANDDLYRKGYPEQLCAFAAFHERHPDSVLLAHTTANRHPVGLNLRSIALRLGIGEAVIFSDENLYSSGSYTPQMLAAMFYGVIDLFSGCAYGEGFGLPIVEAQSCGVPVVVTNCSSMAEVSAPGLAGGYRVPCERFWTPLHQSWWHRPNISDIESAYEQYYREWKDGSISECQVAARQHALQYDIKRVTQDYAIPALKAIEEAL